MRIISFQDKAVWLMIKHGNKQLFENTTEVRFQARYEKLISAVANRMREVLDIPENRYFIPIWGWVVRRDFEFDKENLSELYDRKKPQCNICCALDMEVKNELVLTINFDIWEDIMFKLCFDKDYDFNEDFESLFERKKGATLQVAMPFIHKDFITKVIDLSTYTNKDYSDVENDIKDKISRGTIITDETGQYIEKELES